jgi:hypothetical protein
MTYNNEASPEFNSELLAISYLDEHFGRRHIFPVAALKKFPPCLKDNLASNCSNDVEQIKRWAKQFPKCNWAVAHKKSGLMVVDVDTNPAKGKQGQITYDALDLMYGWAETEKTTTPSGGFHLVYEGEHIMALGKNGLGLDIDAPNYTLIPGCVFADGTSYVGNGATAVPCPDWVYTVIKNSKASARITNASEIVVDQDKPENVTNAIIYLKEDAEPAIEGRGGEFNTYKTACYLKDIGISPTRAVELMLEHYNPRCEPVWEREGLEKKVANAFAYGNLSKAGGKTAEAEFSDDAPDTNFKPIGIYNIKEKKYDKPNSAKIAKAARDRAKVRADEAARPDSEKSYQPTKQEVMDSWMFVSNSSLWACKDVPPPTADDLNRKMYKPAVFDNAFRYLVGDKGKSISESLLKLKKGVSRVTALVYKPGEKIYLRDGNETYFNMYRESPVVPAFDPDNAMAVKALDMWNAHLEYLYPDKTDRDIVLNWFAWLLQNPKLKPKFALVLQGPEQGTGKTFLFLMLEAILDPYNVARVSQKVLASGFNRYAIKAKLLIIEELRSVDRAEVKNTLHELISEDRISINDKNEKLFDLLTCFGVCAGTNADAAVQLENSDRRYAIVKTEAIPKDRPGVKGYDRTYYRRLYAMLKNPVAVAAIAYSLFNRELPDVYDGQGKAPMTAAKAAMIEAGGSNLEHWMVEHGGLWPLSARLISTDDVVTMLPRRLEHERGLDQNIAKILKARFDGVPIRLPVGRDKISLWAINGSPSVNALLQKRAAATKAKEMVKIKNTTAALVAIYEADRVKAGIEKPIDDAGDEFADAVGSP